MAERKTLSKKIRFEVFKRDKFTCQYCGRMSPDVILEIDHIKPVAEGGDNSIINLITSCRDCNRGKGKTLLSENVEIKKQQQQLRDLADKNEQSKMMIEWKKELLEARNEEVETISDLIQSITGYELNDDDSRLIYRLVMRFGFSLVWQSTEISFGKYYDDNNPRSFDKALMKIGGICYNKKEDIIDG